MLFFLEAALAADLITTFIFYAIRGGCASSDLSAKYRTQKPTKSVTKHAQINPHRRCVYSDSPFARIHHFYTAGSRNGLDRVDISGAQGGLQGKTHKKKLPLNERYVF